MPLRPPAGFRSAFYDPLKVADAPTAPAASGGDTQASVTFTAPSNVGGSAITQYYAVSDPSQITGNAASSPVTVTGLTNGTAYTFRVWALNSYGPSPYSAATGSVTPAQLNDGFFAGGTASSYTYTTVEKIIITTTGNSTSFGTLAQSSASGAGCASSTRGLVGGGLVNGGTTGANAITYISLSSGGTGLDFGDLPYAAIESLAACSSSTRGVWAGGYNQVSNVRFNVIAYVTIASTGNAVDFGDLLFQMASITGAAGGTRGVFAAGYVEGVSTISNIIQYITIASTGNATDFGDLIANFSACSSGANSTRMIISGGIDPSPSNVIQYITIASTGNATDFGDLTAVTAGKAGLASSVRFVTSEGSSNSNVMSYVAIASAGNATDFGDLLVANNAMSAFSNAHGGL